MLELGKKARDKITGFEGVITGRAQYITGCDQYALAPTAQGGSVQRTEWFDEGRLEVTGDGVDPAQVQAPQRGGPNRDAPRD